MKFIKFKIDFSQICITFGDTFIAEFNFFGSMNRLEDADCMFKIFNSKLEIAALFSR